MSKSLLMAVVLAASSGIAHAEYQARAGGMKHCPNAVEGAQTAVENTKDGVQMTVTASDKAAAKQIRERARHMAKVSTAGAPYTAPDGKGHGGGERGRCPVVIRGTKVMVKDVDGGAQMLIASRDPERVEAVQKTVTERKDTMKAPAK